MSTYYSFETDRLLVRPCTVEDAPFYLELLNSPKWIANIGDRNVHSVEDAKNYILEKVSPQFVKSGYGTYVVVRKTDGVKLGTCGLYDREGLEGLDIGFAFLPAHEGKGYAYESAEALKRVAIEKFNIRHIKGITTLQNVGSQRLLEKLGLTHVDMIRIPNDDEELMLYVWEE